jgi:hypothetical protein
MRLTMASTAGTVLSVWADTEETTAQRKRNPKISCSTVSSPSFCELLDPVGYPSRLLNSHQPLEPCSLSNHKRSRHKRTVLVLGRSTLSAMAFPLACGVPRNRYLPDLTVTRLSAPDLLSTLQRVSIASSAPLSTLRTPSGKPKPAKEGHSQKARSAQPD